MSAALHDTDFAAWTAEQAELLRARQFDALDIAGLIEEIEDMGGSERSAFGSYLKVVLIHLLKLQFQPSELRLHGRSWILSVKAARLSAKDKLSTNPSLKPHVPEILQVQYAIARLKAADETKLDLRAFPKACPFTREEIFNERWFPNADALKQFYWFDEFAED